MGIPKLCQGHVPSLALGFCFSQGFLGSIHEEPATVEIVEISLLPFSNVCQRWQRAGVDQREVWTAVVRNNGVFVSAWTRVFGLCKKRAIILAKLWLILQIYYQMHLKCLNNHFCNFMSLKMRIVQFCASE